jgi:hypothetical protein
MKAENSSMGSVKGMRRRLRWLSAALLVLVIVASACSGGNDDAGDSGSESTTNKAPREASESQSGSDSSDREAEPTKEKAERGGSYSGSNKKVRAGQLTAGEWDDSAAWEAFRNLLNGQEAESSKQVWGFRDFQRLEVVVSANGKALSDAEVVLQDGNEDVWRARTNTDGIAYVYAGLYDSDQRYGGSYSVQVRAGQETKTMQGLDITKQGTVKVDLGPNAAGAGPSDQVDLMFVVDTTGSMDDELNYLTAELKDVVQRVSDEHANQLGLRVSANFYRDNSDSYVIRPHPFTTDIDKVVDQFGQQNASGGGDFPEAVDQALRDAVHEHDWSEEARARLLFLVLDAPPHEEPQIIDEMHKLIEAAASKGIMIIPVASSGVDVDTEYLLRFMSVATGGTYLFLTDDSGIGGDHLEPAAGEYEVKLLNDLLVEVINRYVT